MSVSVLKTMIIAADIGNSRVKLGAFDFPPAPSKLPAPAAMLALSAADWDDDQLSGWLDRLPGIAEWWLASVNRPAADRLARWIASRSDRSRPSGPRVRQIDHRDLPLKTSVPQPENVGIDRLAGAVAANRLRDSNRPAITVQVGTAITVNLVNAEGVFCGGAILPGIAMAARALAELTDRLPHAPLEQLSEPSEAVGTSTIGAIHSGLYWGAVGAMRELASRMTPQGGPAPQVFLTGGAAPAVARTLDLGAQYVEHLVLAGIALATSDSA